LQLLEPPSRRLEIRRRNAAISESPAPLPSENCQPAPTAKASRNAKEMRRLLRSAVAEVIPFTLATGERYAGIRGTSGMTPADAIHLACAAEAHTDLLLTNH